MGFGFNLFFIFILLPLTIVLLLAGLLTGNKVFRKAIVFICIGILGLVLSLKVLRWLMAKKELKRKDYYGQYVIDRSYFPGRQADWQYDHFRFEIKENDSIYFYVTAKDKVRKTYSGTITTTAPYRSERLVIHMEEPVHHILENNPITYRSAWGFYLVFYSPKFKNVYFKKGHWKQLTKNE